MSESLYVSCAEVLSLCQSTKDDLAALLDPETGFAPRLRQLCREQIEEYEDGESTRATQEMIELLRLEENTWALLQAVMPPRKVAPSPLPTARTLLRSNPYTPPSTLAQAIMRASRLLTELVVVREWLHDTAPMPTHPEATTGYCKFTKYGVMQALRTGAARHRDVLVRHMDPDAPAREEGRSLAVDDANYEKSLMQALYGYIRAGRLEDAMDLCKKAHQPWRAASIHGSRVFRWPAISTELRDQDTIEDDPEAWSGNRRRNLWKYTCTRAALNPNLPDHERVLYAALAPSPQTSSILKSSCRTWEDHLWAQLSIVCEEKQSTEMAKLQSSFWEAGLDALAKAVAPPEEEEVTEAVEEEWAKEVISALESLKHVAVLEGPAADHAFHFSQLHIILDRTETLLESFATGLQDGSIPNTSFEYPTMCRFFAHFCLFLQMIDVPVPPLAMQIILEAYLQVLEAAGQRELIALYAGALGENAVERYALFLVSLELAADVGERRLALTRARDHGLDMARVAVATAERTIDKAFDMLPPLKGPLPSIIALQPPPTDPELFLLRSIEWTTFLDATYDTALEQANVILRYFLASGRLQLARTLLDMLPPELAGISEPEEQATEYLHYRQFFVIWETLDQVVECQAREVGLVDISREARNVWLREYQDTVDRCYNQITKLLTSEWLVTDVEAEGGDRRRFELIRIRQMYIPELIIRLHATLFASRRWIPENLKRALQLANTVADSRYKLYEDFVNQEGRRLGDYLGAVRQAVLGGLESGGSDPFRVLVQ